MIFGTARQASIGTLIGELKAAGVPKHVGMSYKSKLGRQA